MKSSHRRDSHINHLRRRTLTYLVEELIIELSPDEIIIRIEASPINPTDIGLLLGPADLSGMATFSLNGRQGLRAPIPSEYMDSLKSRIGKSLPVGTEGAGTVVRAGANAVDLMGKTVSTMSVRMYPSFSTCEGR